MKNAATFSAEGMQRILTQGVDPDSPVVTEGGETYLKYDQIVIHVLGDGTKIHFLWRVEVMLTVEAGVVALTDRVSINGVEGRVGVSIGSGE